MQHRDYGVKGMKKGVRHEEQHQPSPRKQSSSVEKKSFWTPERKQLAGTIGKALLFGGIGAAGLAGAGYLLSKKLNQGSSSSGAAGRLEGQLAHDPLAWKIRAAGNVHKMRQAKNAYR